MLATGWRTALAGAAYSTLLRLATPLYLARLWWRGAREPGYRVALAERLALGGPAQTPGALWLHAVSLGETKAAAVLIDALRARQPDLRLLLTHGTATGRAAGRALLREGDRQTWLPLDTPGAVRRFLQQHRPALGVLMETEVWPNLLQAAETAGVPIVLANARLSERSARRGERFAALLRPAAQRITLALAQTEDDARRLRQAGVPQVEVAGNLKYDLRADAALLARGQAWRARPGRPVLAMTNTRDGEEARLLAAWRQTAWRGPAPLLLIVPRHPQRFDAVAALVAQAGLSLSRRSAWGEAGPDGAACGAEVWLGDSLGEMSAYYGAADLALLGGSFEPLGGHNLIESAACGCPIVLGPSTFNFADAAERALAEGAAWRAADLPQALAWAAELLADAPRLTGAARAAQAFSARHRGAAERMAGRIEALFTSPAAR
ncbi:3-deoxy-D-manno-octulosonic acid transferase [Ideonella sp. 4Y11]|uniref:3-deoxy-D-manno-octulosonic acid transferase n=1 Tax=Ideonella aquatica TaxID=2824119 RepID=A0A941BLY7_9BURK|nr:3-deoxy-D-manno-octulosonic acid transferase [Ideonella aquatica]MBQ0961453.1 3-deoxy-D-manno-octulosonic acid transferase [Ideonella aquatica]